MRRARGSIATDVARSRTRSRSKRSARDKKEPQRGDEKCFFSGDGHVDFAPRCTKIAERWIWWTANRGPKARNVCNACRNQFVKSGEATDLKDEDGEDGGCSEPEMNAGPSEHHAAEVETWQLCCPHCDQWIVVEASVKKA